MTDTTGSAATALAGNPPAPAGAGDTPPPPAPWFGEANKNLVEAKGWKSPDDALASYRGLETLLGADKAGRGMVIPKDDTDEAGWNAVYGKLGRPDKPDGYKVPDQIKDDPLVTEFSTHAHKLGLTARQYEETMKWVVERTTARQTETEQAREAEFAKASDALKREWGNAYDANVELARRGVRQFGVDEATLTKMEASLGPAGLFKLFHSIGSKLGEDTGGAAGQGTGGGGLTPGLARQRQTEMWNDPKTNAILLDKMHPQHAEVQARWEELSKAVAAGG